MLIVHMKLSEDEIKTILERVKETPQTVNDIAHLIDRSWVTTEKYLHELRDTTGLINLKTFREGTQGALKIVYFTPTPFSIGDEVKQSLSQQILAGKQKDDFDFMDVFQFIPENQKHSFTRTIPEEQHMSSVEMVKKLAQKKLFYFSGNMSFVSTSYPGKESVIDMMEKQLSLGVQIKILCRVSLSSLSNIESISNLLIKYPQQFEIRHRYHPLRGMIIDDSFARFKSWEEKDKFRPGELNESTRIYYEITSPEWIAWMESVFWQMWRSSIPYDQRIKEIQRITE